MSITPDVPPPDDSDSYSAPSIPRWIPAVLIVLLLGLGGLMYAGYQSRAQLEGELAATNSRADLVIQQLEQTNQRVAELRGQLDVTSQKLGLTQEELARARMLAQQIQKEQQANDAKLSAQIGQVQQTSEEKFGQVADELTGAKTEIAATQQQLEETQSRLTSTIGDLGVQSGLIARNSEELAELRRMNERNYFEFDLAKTKAPQRVGPIQLRLQKTDPKRYRFTLTVIADDKAIEKKDRNVDEPMQFYVGRTRHLYEIVIFEVAKDRITGYLSAPKEMASASVVPTSVRRP